MPASIESVALLKTYAAMPITLVRGRGVWVEDDKGTEYLDLYAGHAVASTGHAHPKVVEAIQTQAGQLMFYSTTVDLEVRRRAAEKLAAVSPLPKVLFVNSGAEAIENALRMAKRSTGRTKIVAMKQGFHGRTAGAISVTGIGKYRFLQDPPVDGAVFVDFGDVDALAKAADNAAAVIFEPIPSMAGVLTAPAVWYQSAREICDRVGAKLIYDEVQTGVGRTGTMFFAGRHGVVPDLIALGKGLASGLPVGAVLVSAAIADGVQYGDYGSTFGGGPIVMAAVEATLDVVKEELPNVQRVGAMLADFRGEGLIRGGVTKRPAKEVQAALRDEEILVGTSEDPNVIRLLPPLVLREEHVKIFREAWDKLA